MIDKNKTYRTRDGREVRIYAVDGLEPYPVHGAIRFDSEWSAVCWRADGTLSAYSLGDSDLIEVKPRIHREVWVNVYPTATQYGLYQDKGTADCNATERRVACVKLTIDCEKGEGL